jgi:hypothetical protein
MLSLFKQLGKSRWRKTHFAATGEFRPEVDQLLIVLAVLSRLLLLDYPVVYTFELVVAVNRRSLNALY